MFKKFIQCLIISLLLSRAAWAQQPPQLPKTTAEQQLGFARHLFEQKDYYRAITEYQRFIFLYPQHPQTPPARFQIGACYFAGEEWKKAIKTWQADLGDSLPEELRQQTLYQIAAGYYKLEEYTTCRKYLEKLNQEHPQSALRRESRKLLAASYLEQGLWDNAAEVVRQMQTPLAKDLSARILEGKDLPQKSPSLAGTLSAIVPGAGQLYTGRTQDAIMSFMLNGLFIWGSIEAFSHDKTATGIILLFFETGWYFGNIYSATNSAYKYNEKSRQNFRNETRERLQFKLGLPDVGPLGLSLSYRF